MKYDPQKAFPYPVLRPCSNDYDESDFQTIVDYNSPEGSNEIIFDITYALSSDEIKNEIKVKNASFVTLIACRDTYYRHVIESSKSHVKESINCNLLRGEIQIFSYVIAKNSIPSFNSKEIHEEFGNGPFSFSAGEVLAQDAPDLLYLDRDLFKPVTSVFDLVKNDNLKNAEWGIKFEQDHVQIELSAKMKEKIDSARNSTANKAILLNSIYFSAIMEALYQLKLGEECPYKEYKWAQIIERQAVNKNIDLKNQPAHQIASVLMQYPLMHLDTYVFKEND